MRVVDLGTGDGILALAAARLGASHALAIDCDPGALENAQRNVKVNGLSRIIQVKFGEGPPDGIGEFHLLVVNISAKTVTDLAPRLLHSLAPGGTLVASGVLDSEEPQVAQCLKETGVCGLEVRRKEEWVTIVGTVPSPSRRRSKNGIGSVSNTTKTQI